jgi:hypothetical protein
MRRLIVLLTTLLAVTSVHADVFPVPYTGQLTLGGTPANGKHFFSIAIYDVPSGGAPLFFQADTLTVTAGVYSTFLNTPETVWGDARWIGVSIDGGIELAPRVEVGAVPYAIIAGRAMEAVHSARADTANVAIAPPGSGLSQSPSSTFLTLPASAQTDIDSVTIICPAPGRVLVTATGFVQISGAPSTEMGGVFLGLGTNPVLLQINAYVNQLIPYSCSKSFTVFAPGPLTIRLYGINTNPTHPVGVNSSTVIALYVPKGY